jgi:glycosyltransferase involved in cell wall biosynthesis
MDNVKISVIVPVYNTEKHLSECLDSIINQTLKEIEIICVNDESMDGSLDILKNYSKKDERIHIINKKNEGAAAARNTGLDNAKGEYIGFVDSDDWIALDMYEKLYNNAKIYNSDIVMCPLNVYNDSSKEFEQPDHTCTLEHFSDKFDNRAFNHLETKEFFFSISVTPPNKIYNFDFLKRINARFPEGLMFEDNPFFYYIYLNAERVSIIRDYLYFYRKNRFGSTTNKHDVKFFDLIKINELNKDIFIQTNNYEIYKVDLMNYSINSIFMRFNQVREEYKSEFFSLIKNYLERLKLRHNDIENLNYNLKIFYENFISCESFLDYQLLNLKKLNTKLKKENIELKKINKTYKNKLIKIESSNSWKLTKPLRKLIIILKIR